MYVIENPPAHPPTIRSGFSLDRRAFHEQSCQSHMSRGKPPTATSSLGPRCARTRVDGRREKTCAAPFSLPGPLHPPCSASLRYIFNTGQRLSTSVVATTPMVRRACQWDFAQSRSTSERATQYRHDGMRQIAASFNLHETSATSRIYVYASTAVPPSYMKNLGLSCFFNRQNHSNDSRQL